MTSHHSPIPAGDLVTEQLYLIRKGGSYYRPNAQGYTNHIAEAGRYTLEEAIAYSHPNGPNGPRDGISYLPAPAIATRYNSDLSTLVEAAMPAVAAMPEENTFEEGWFRGVMKYRRNLDEALAASPAHATGAAMREATVQDILYLCTAAKAHANKFPVPSHIRELVDRISAALSSPAPEGEAAVMISYDDFFAAYRHVPRSKMFPDDCLKTRLRALLHEEDLAHADEAEAIASAQEGEAAQGVGPDVNELARELWWPHHSSHKRSDALSDLDHGSAGQIVIEYADVVSMVEATIAALAPPSVKQEGETSR